jgi:hypothetical protein
VEEWDLSASDWPKLRRYWGRLYMESTEIEIDHGALLFHKAA